MSASEKLRALDEAASQVPWHFGNNDPGSKYRDEELIVVLRNALPQLVATVEALERVLRPWDKVSNPVVDDALAFARDALADLHEALT